MTDAMTDAEKRKEAAPTPEEPEAKRPKVAEDEAKATPLKPTPADPKVVRKQVEYYLSDENLKGDKFFHEKITGDPEGWLDLSLVLTCNKMKAMHTTKQDVLLALKESTVEFKELPDGGGAVRRPGNAALPKLEPRQQNQKKQLHAHDGGVVAVFRDIPEEQSWMQVKEKLRAKLPEKVHLWYVSPVSDKGQCMVSTGPFDEDLAFFQAVKLEVGGKTLSCEICFGDLLQQHLKLLPRHIREKREKEARKRMKDKNKPILVGSQKFLNVAALRGRVKEILNSRSEGEALKPDGTDFKLIKALLAYHPSAEKSKGLTGLKVATSSHGDNRCFFIVRESGEAEDFSAKKCLDAIELTPPYVEDKAAASSSAAAAPAAAPASAAEPAAASSASPSPPAVAAVVAEAAPAVEAAASAPAVAAAAEEKKAS